MAQYMPRAMTAGACLATAWFGTAAWKMSLQGFSYSWAHQSSTIKSGELRVHGEHVGIAKYHAKIPMNQKKSCKRALTSKAANGCLHMGCQGQKPSKLACCQGVRQHVLCSDKISR